MRHDPLSDLKDILIETLTTDYQVTTEEANQLAAKNRCAVFEITHNPG